MPLLADTQHEDPLPLSSARENLSGCFLASLSQFDEWSTVSVSLVSERGALSPLLNLYQLDSFSYAPPAYKQLGELSHRTPRLSSLHRRADTSAAMKKKEHAFTILVTEKRKNISASGLNQAVTTLMNLDLFPM